ncbi:MAG: flippase [Saprospiraceae bacterium]
MSNNKSYWLKSGLFTLFEKGSVFLFGFGSTYLLLRALTKEQFGVWVIFFAVISFVEVGRIGLLQNALVKYLATVDKDDEKQYSSIVTASFVLNLILTAICIGIIALVAQPLAELNEAPELINLLYIYMITTSLLVPFHQFNFIQQGNFDFKGIFWSNFTRQGLFFCFVVVIYFSSVEVTLTKLALWQIVTAVAGAITSWWFARPYLRFSRQLSWEWVSKLFHFGKYVFGTNLSTTLYKTIDRLMLGTLLSPIATATYEVAIRITNLADVPTFSIAAIVFPQSAKQMKEDGQSAIKDLYEKSVGAILAFLIPFFTFIWIFAEPIITIIATEKYLDAVPILRWTLLFGLFMPFAVQFGTVLDSIGKPNVNFFFTLFSAVLNVVFNYVFIINYGVIGAAYGTVLTYAVIFVLMQIILNRMLGVVFWNAFKNIIPFYQQAYEIAMEKLGKREMVADESMELPQEV